MTSLKMRKSIRENVTSGCSQSGFAERQLLISFTENALCDLGSDHAVTSLW